MSKSLKSVDGVGTTPSAPSQTNYHSVEVGKKETLKSIAKETGFPLEDIQKLNQHIKSSSKVLQAGQEIALPRVETKSKPANKTDLETSLINQSKTGSQVKQNVLDPSLTVAGYAGKLGEAADPKVAAKMGQLEKQIAGLQSDLPKIQARVSGEVRKAIDMLGAGKMTKAEFSEQLSKQTAKLADVQTEIRSVEKEINTMGQAGKVTGKLKEVSKALDDLGKVKTTLGKCAFGLDIAFNFAEYQDKDPSNLGFNLTKAVTASAANFSLAAGMSKTSTAGAAGALLKLGLECTGMKNTPLYDGVDVATQCLPTEIFSKNVLQVVDQAQGIKEFIASGGRDTARLERVNEANMKGENGLFLQGVVILGDVLSNKGQNVPTDGPGVRIAESMGFYGHTDIETRDQGRTVGQKVSLVNKLLSGNHSGDDELRVLNLLHQTDPRTLAQTLQVLDKTQLVHGLKNRNQTIDPAAELVANTYLKSNQATDPSTQNELKIMAKDLVNECIVQKRHEALRYLSSQGLLAKLDIHLR